MKIVLLLCTAQEMLLLEVRLRGDRRGPVDFGSGIRPPNAEPDGAARADRRPAAARRARRFQVRSLHALEHRFLLRFRVRSKKYLEQVGHWRNREASAGSERRVRAAREMRTGGIRSSIAFTFGGHLERAASCRPRSGLVFGISCRSHVAYSSSATAAPRVKSVLAT